MSERMARLVIALSDMLLNGANMPLVIEEDDLGRVVVTELARRPSTAKSATRWNSADWEVDDKSRLMFAMLSAWDRMHTALAADPTSDTDAMMVLLDRKEAFLDAANDFCALMSGPPIVPTGTVEG